MSGASGLEAPNDEGHVVLGARKVAHVRAGVVQDALQDGVRAAVERALDAPPKPLLPKGLAVSALAAEPGRTFATLAFATSQAQQGVWSALLERAAGSPEANGCLVGRVFTRDDAGRLRPRADAAVSTVGAPTAAQCAPDAKCLRFFDATPALDALLPVGAQRTSLAGAFLFIRGGDGAYRGVFNVTDPADTYPTLPGGTNIGSGSHLPFVPTL